VSVGIGASCILWGFAIKLFPLHWFGKIQINEAPLTDEEERQSIVAKLRKSHRQSVRQAAKQTDEFNRRASVRELNVRKSRQASVRASQRGAGTADYKPHGSRAIN